MDLEAMGRRMRAAREALGLTQAQVAKAIGRSPLFYGYIERGTRSMSLVTFSAVTRALDISADELLGLGEFCYKKDQRARKPPETTCENKL